MLGRTKIAFGLFAVIATASPALAHHSHVMFDFEKSVEIKGTVKTFKWTNPHSWLHVVAPNAKGQNVEHAIEMGSIAGLVGQGWKPKTVVPGDKVTISIHPMKDGSPGGEIRYIVLPNGNSLGEGHEKAEFPNGIPR